MLRARIDLHRCIGAGSCVAIAPTAFGWDERSHGKVILLDPGTVEDDTLREAALACPTQAIVLDDDDADAGMGRTTHPGDGAR